MKNSIQILMIFLASLFFAQQTSFQFDFGGERVEKGFIPITSTSQFDKKLGYGFMDVSGLKTVDNEGNALTGDYIASNKPFLFFGGDS
jgi:hypothetical protein